MQRVVGKIPKTVNNEIWVVVTDFTGEVRLDIREYFYSDGEAGFLPTKKGIAVPVAEIPALREALQVLAESTEPGVIARLSRTPRTEIQVGVRTYQGHTYAELRLFFLAGPTDYRPSPKGVTLNLSFVPLLAEMVGEAEAAIAA
jgi:hypothetical protein